MYLWGTGKSTRGCVMLYHVLKVWIIFQSSFLSLPFSPITWLPRPPPPPPQITLTPSGFPGSLEKLEVLVVLDLNTHNVHSLLNLPTKAIVSYHLWLVLGVSLAHFTHLWLPLGPGQFIWCKVLKMLMFFHLVVNV